MPKLFGSFCQHGEESRSATSLRSWQARRRPFLGSGQNKADHRSSIAPVHNRVKSAQRGFHSLPLTAY